MAGPGNIKDGFTTRMSPRTEEIAFSFYIPRDVLHLPIRQQRQTDRALTGLLSMRNSKNRANTGEVKQRTMRSPMGIRGMAARLAGVTLDMSSPYRETISHWFTEILSVWSFSA